MTPGALKDSCDSDSECVMKALREQSSRGGDNVALAELIQSVPVVNCEQQNHPQNVPRMPGDLSVWS